MPSCMGAYTFITTWQGMKASNKLKLMPPLKTAKKNALGFASRA